MLISFNWLKKHINLPSTVEASEVAARLKASTVEVEGLKKQNELLENVVVGKVVKADKHPNADKLKVCKVDVGNEELQIVCGGSNVYEGMLCAVGKVGAKVKWHGEGEPVVLSPTKIRGEESFGMICASTEIGLGEIFPLKDEKEILDLTEKKFRVGLSLSEVLGLNDIILEIDNKSLSNRPDLWGHYGIAREVAVLFDRELKKYETKKISSGKGFELSVKVEDQKLCTRYMAVAVSGIKIEPSPKWLQEALLSIGQNPINNIVDITNYVLFDLGQPLHAFDAKEIHEGELVVRRAQNGEKITALNGVEYNLVDGDLLIADKMKPLVVAGVKGGKNSGINDLTSTVVFESANFDATAVRKTASRLGLRTDSAVRFEKSLDPNQCLLALEKAVELTLEICPGAKVASKVVDEKNFHLATGPIQINDDLFADKLGVKIDIKEAVHILEKLGFSVKSKKDSLAVTIPTWRATKDISIAEDLVEEVVRFFGYENIPSVLPALPIDPPEKNILRALERKIADELSVGFGYTEVYNYSFVSENQILKMGDSLEKYLELDNPLSKERPFLRRSLLPNLLENVEKNIEKHGAVKIFEIGKVFSRKEIGLRTDDNGDKLLPLQDTYLGVVFSSKKDGVPYWQVNRVLSNLSLVFGLNIRTLPPEIVEPWEHPTRLAVLMSGEKMIGVISEINPLISEKLGVEQRVAVLQLNLSTVAQILENKTKVSSYKPSSIYPEVVRDLAILVKKDVSHAQILKALKSADSLLVGIDLFDVYEGISVGEGYKSMAYHLIYKSDDRTLTTAEVDGAFAKIEKVLKEKFGAELRK